MKKISHSLITKLISENGVIPFDFIDSWETFIESFVAYQETKVWQDFAHDRITGTIKIINSIIHPEAYIGDFTLIRNSIIGKGVRIGAHCQVNKSIINENSEFPHFNNIGYSFISNNVLFGSGVNTSSVRLDNKYPFVILENNEKIVSSTYKYGAIVGENVKIGNLTTINPFTIIEKNSVVRPHQELKGIIKNDSQQCINIMWD